MLTLKINDMQRICNSQNCLGIISQVHWEPKMLTAMIRSEGYCKRLLFLPYSFPLFIFICSFFVLTLSSRSWHQGCCFRVWVSDRIPSVLLPLWSEPCPQPRPRQSQGLLFFPVFRMLCQPLNAAPCAQMWFSCKLIAAPCVKTAWPVPRQPVRMPPAPYISIARWPTARARPALLATIFFFSFLFHLSKQKEEVWGKNKRCLPFIENHQMP